MIKDFKFFLWLLKFGALVNLYFFGQTFLMAQVSSADAQIIFPAQILFAVSAFRCLFPVRYKNNTVFHNSPLSSIFITRLFATFSEIALIYQLAYIIRLLNVVEIGWITWLSWAMVGQVVLSQVFVWGAILTERLELYYYEELGWFFIYGANTLASVYLYATLDTFGGRELLIQLNFLFGAVYLPWQIIHLRGLHSDAHLHRNKAREKITRARLIHGLRQAIMVKNQTSDPQAWGNLIGLTWMTAYWATLIPMWVYQMVKLAGL